MLPGGTCGSALVGQVIPVADSPDAVVVGAGPNGLVAANLLADAGWDVLVLEEQPEPGGAVRSAEVTAPGFVSDLYSSFYPLAVGSPVIARLRLEEHGLRWRHAPQVLAHPLLDGRTAVLSRDLATTAASVGAFHGDDDGAWRDLVDQWRALSPHVVGTVTDPFPPVRSATALVRRLGPREALRFARFATLSVRRFSEERFRGEGAALLLAGNAMHTDLAPEAAGSAVFGWLLAMLGQDVGFPVPEGGAGMLTRALVDRLAAHGGRVECGARVDQVVVQDGRAVAVRCADGRTIAVRRAVLADVPAPALYHDLLAATPLPARLRADLDAFSWDDGTVKVDWALAGPIPWSNPEVEGAGTVHLAGDLEQVSRFAHQLSNGYLPDDPFLLLGQMTTADATRSPAGTESAWAYTHVPRVPKGDAAGVLAGDLGDPREQQVFLDRVERRVEQFAPGFRDLVLERRVAFPADLQAGDANLVGGAINGGTSGLHQQLFLRPTPGLGRPETFVRGLYLASASAHPGGGVHGACGANAARAALRSRTTGRLALAVTRWSAGGASAACAAPASPGAAGSPRSAG